jgi:hypothetical protein
VPIEGDPPPSRLSVDATLTAIIVPIRQAWPEVRITIRADSGLCRWRLVRWCDSQGIGYVLGLGRNKALERLATCHRFLANQFRLLLSSAAYVLLQALRRTAVSPRVIWTVCSSNPRWPCPIRA